jgi:hypothetical protein
MENRLEWRRSAAGDNREMLLETLTAELREEALQGLNIVGGDNVHRHGADHRCEE